MRMTRSEALARIEALPEGQNGEFVGGELVVSPRPASPHLHAATRLGALLMPTLEEGLGDPGGWRFLNEPELHLGEDILVPDVAAWRTGRMERMPVTPAFTLAPDWICEVLSPSTMRFDRAAKMRAYAAAGVQWAWLVDPLAHTLEIHRRAGDRWLVEDVRAGEADACAAPFDAAPLPLGRLWLT